MSYPSNPRSTCNFSPFLHVNVECQSDTLALSLSLSSPSLLGYLLEDWFPPDLSLLLPTVLWVCPNLVKTLFPTTTPTFPKKRPAKICPFRPYPTQVVVSLALLWFLFNLFTTWSLVAASEVLVVLLLLFCAGYERKSACFRIVLGGLGGCHGRQVLWRARMPSVALSAVLSIGTSLRLIFHLRSGIQTCFCRFAIL